MDSTEFKIVPGEPVVNSWFTLFEDLTDFIHVGDIKIDVQAVPAPKIGSCLQLFCPYYKILFLIIFIYTLVTVTDEDKLNLLSKFHNSLPDIPRVNQIPLRKENHIFVHFPIIAKLNIELVLKVHKDTPPKEISKLA